ncbi:MAG: hypothetical protein RLO17_13740 [Cyclobacteriaceae bacterium]
MNISCIPSTVTPIELDEDKKLGIFYADLRCGEDCGGGYLVIFMHIDGVWELVEMLELWSVKLPSLRYSDIPTFGQLAPTLSPGPL